MLALSLNVFIVALVNAVEQLEYCIIGAGPAGIQLGHFLLNANRSYRIFEKSHRVGSFFAVQGGRGLPVHRRLISINKRVTGSTDAEFNMRHDWNSLLGDHVPRMVNRSRELYPQADVLADYLHDFAGVQIDAGKIAFGSEVRKVASDQESEYHFQLRIQDASVQCKIVVAACGFQIAKRLAPNSEKLVIGYEALPAVSPEKEFDGKYVAVLGGGNAAFETAEALQNIARVKVFKHASQLPWQTRIGARLSDLLPGGFERDADGTRFAMMTHYVGDVRAHRLGIFDAYQLKMPDQVETVDPQLQFNVYRCWNDKLCIWALPEEEVEGPNFHLPIPVIFKEEQASSISQAISTYLREHPHFTKDDFSVIDVRKFHALSIAGHMADPGDWGSDDWSTSIGDTIRLQIAPRILEEDPNFFGWLKQEANLAEWDQTGTEPLVVDAVIRCFGWKVDLSLFDTTSVPVMTTNNGKYPQITDTYEADGAPGLFFAGTLAHSLDFRRSAGGFVHGFRYSIRALFRYLEETRHGVPWPSLSFDLSSSRGMRELLDRILYRINFAAGPYQMFGGTLLDGIIFRESNKSVQCTGVGHASQVGAEGLCNSITKAPMNAMYYEEMQPAYLHHTFKDQFRLIWFFEYGEGFAGPHVLQHPNIGAYWPEEARQSTFLHPRLQLFAPQADSMEKPVLEHWLQEDIEFRFKHDIWHVKPLASFLNKVAGVVAG